MEDFDFSGYATKAGLKCSDGRTIMPEAFKHQDKMTVPLVWHHGGKDNPENVLGHAVLEARDDGIYTYCFFNKTPRAIHAKELVHHKDIKAMSIWANQLVEKAKTVLHGAIREVSLVMSGANPGALIDNIVIRHSDDPEDIEKLEDEAIIFTGLELELEHEDADEDKTDEGIDEDKTNEDKSSDDATHAAGDKEETVQDILDTMDEKQKQVLHYLVGEAVAETNKELKQTNLSATDTGGTDDSGADESGTDDSGTNNDDSKGKEMKHNVFETENDKGEKTEVVLSHDDMEGIAAQAKKLGSFKAAVEEYAEEHLEHGIEDIDILFPDAKALSSTPELFGRRVEWVSTFLSGVRKIPFTRIKTLSADLTVAEARAKGYVKGTLKKEEFFRVSKRVTTPTTVYKKQKLDRDDMIDITDFDVVVWLKAEMRIMLDEEIARAALVGDGRAADDEDKIDEERIRPIASDHEVYVTTAYVNLGDANSTFREGLDAIVRNRRYLRGSGTPTMFTTETYIAEMLLLRDQMGRKEYKSLEEVASEHRVSSIVPVEILEEYDDIVAILVNLNDYVMGANNGGQVSMFDDFDIDYNQYKYLIETRVCGALVKMKSALVIRKTASNAVLTVPAAPAFDGDAITITNQTGVVYRNKVTDAVMDAAGSPYAVADGVTVTVVAEPATSAYYFATSNDDEWAFTGEA